MSAEASGDPHLTRHFKKPLSVGRSVLPKVTSRSSGSAARKKKNTLRHLLGIV